MLHVSSRAIALNPSTASAWSAARTACTKGPGTTPNRQKPPRGWLPGVLTVTLKARSTHATAWFMIDPCP
jgi:hypothetical protein